MRTRPTTATPLGTAPHAVDVLVPDARVRFPEHAGIALRAAYDSIAARTVPDHEQTYYLRALEQQYQQIEAALLLDVERCVATIELRLAELADAVTEDPVEPPREVGGSPGTASSERAAWAHGVRAVKRARAAERGRQQRVESARRERAALEVARRVLLDEAEAARLLCEKAFALRAAIYTRRRFGLFGMGRRDHTVIPAYAALPAPPAARRALTGLVGQLTPSDSTR